MFCLEYLVMIFHSFLDENDYFKKIVLAPRKKIFMQVVKHKARGRISLENKHKKQVPSGNNIQPRIVNKLSP